MRFEATAPLCTLQASAIERIDADAVQFRASLITATPGQEMVYASKLSEARDYLASVEPSTANYPWVSAESQARGISPREAAETIISAAATWDRKGAAIEEARIRAKCAIRGATDAAGIREAEVTFRECLSGLP